MRVDQLIWCLELDHTCSHLFAAKLVCSEGREASSSNKRLTERARERVFAPSQKGRRCDRSSSDQPCKLQTRQRRGRKGVRSRARVARQLACEGAHTCACPRPALPCRAIDGRTDGRTDLIGFLAARSSGRGEKRIPRGLVLTRSVPTRARLRALASQHRPPQFCVHTCKRKPLMTLWNRAPGSSTGFPI